MPIAEATAKETKTRGCYSIRYFVDDPVYRGLEFSMDFGWRFDTKAPNDRWICADREGSTGRWIVRRIIPDHGLGAILDHFGLIKDDLGTLLCRIYEGLTPAFLVRVRREKERREDLPYKLIQNMKLGCPSDERLPENFGPAE